MSKSRERNLLSKSEWDEKDVRAWLHSHLGEYIVKRAEIHRERMEDRAEHSDSFWLFESVEALASILPCSSFKGYPLESYARVVKEAEPEVQRVIKAINELTQKGS